MLYHILRRPAWQTAEISGEYRPPLLISDGYMRLVTREKLLALARRHHAGQNDLLVLAINEDRLVGYTHRAYEDGLLLVHLHSALPIDAVVNLYSLTTDAEGAFTLPPPLRAQRPAAPAAPAQMIYHILNRHAWQTAMISGEYRPPSLAEEGFIHFSGRDQVVAVANRFYAEENDLLLLQVDAAQRAIAPHVRYEAVADSDETFPHLYSALPLDAVLDSYTLPRGADGQYELPAILQREKPPTGAA